MQRVSRASVTVAGERVANVDEPGLCVLLGVTHTDTPEIARTLAGKVHGLRIMREEQSAADLGAPVLVVSQFTLYGDIRKGRRPSWLAAAPGPVAEPLVDEFAEELRRRGAPVQTGVFGADMAVDIVNDGPVTLVLEFPA